MLCNNNKFIYAYEKCNVHRLRVKVQEKSGQILMLIRPGQSGLQSKGASNHQQMTSAQIYFAHVASTFTSQVMPLCISWNVYRTASRPHDPAEYKYEMPVAQFFIRDDPRGRFFVARSLLTRLKNTTSILAGLHVSNIGLKKLCWMPKNK